MPVLETERLVLVRLSGHDAAFILRLLNEPAYLQYIGDRGVRTLEDARRYVRDGPGASYAARGFGLLRVDLKEEGAPIGICGLLKRNELDDVDLGFAFLRRYRRRGFASETARAVLGRARGHWGLRRVAAVVQSDNAASMRTLLGLGFAYEKHVRLSEDRKRLRLYAAEI